MHDQPAILFDPDATLVDRVYQHLLARRHAPFNRGFDLSAGSG